MGVTLPWRLFWTTSTLTGTHPTLPGWTIHQWSGDLDEIKSAVLGTFLTQMMSNKPILLDQAATHRLDGWSIYVPITRKYYNRCVLWDAIWHTMVIDQVPEDILSHAIGVHDMHDVVTRLSPIRGHESWDTWHQEVYRVLENPPWATVIPKG